MDAYDEDWDRLWWVRADGDARILRPEACHQAAREERRCAIAALRRKYAAYRQQPPDGAVITIAVRRRRGWRAADRDGIPLKP